jgi:hypothetical protein
MSLPDGVYRFRMATPGVLSPSDNGPWRAFDPSDSATLDAIAEALRPAIIRRSGEPRLPGERIAEWDLRRIRGALAEVFKG